MFERQEGGVTFIEMIDGRLHTDSLQSAIAADAEEYFL